MNRKITGRWLLAAGLLAASVTVAAPQPLDVTIYVYNVARVPLGTLRKAEGNAARIFGRAQVKIAWCEGRTSVPKGQEIGFHGSPWARDNIDLRLYTEKTLSGVRLYEGKLGLVLSLEGNSAGILWDRVQALAELQQCDTAAILGAAISHEIGHLLLRTSGHTSEGIMQKNWLPADLHAAAQSRLLFTKDQSKRMNEVYQRQHPPVSRSKILANTNFTCAASVD